MAIKNSSSKRIDSELENVINNIKQKNDMNFRQASKEAAKIIKQTKIKRREIEF